MVWFKHVTYHLVQAFVAQWCIYTIWNVEVPSFYCAPVACRPSKRPHAARDELCIESVVPLLEPIMTFADIVLAFSESILHASPSMHAPEFEGIATESVNLTTECQVKTDNKNAM